MRKALFLILLGGVLWPLTSCTITRKFVYYPQTISEKRVRSLQHASPDIREVRIPIKAGRTLHGWLIAKDLQRYPTLLYFGGNSEEVSRTIDGFRRLQANVVLMNYRGYGLSHGSPSERALKSDAETIYEVLRETYQVPAENIIACGRSLGTGIAAHLAYKKSLSKLILIAPYDTLENVACLLTPALIPDWLVRALITDPYRTTDFSPKIISRTWIIASPNDEIIPIENTLRLYHSLQSEKTLHKISAATHNTFQNFSEYWAALEECIQYSSSPVRDSRVLK